MSEPLILDREAYAARRLTPLDVVDLVIARRAQAKDNIDAAGLATTAGCPAFAYEPQAHATVVARLRAAGALLVGKTNLDQFATGLNGTRSPFGAPRSVFDADYISGGSSSGSAVAVASGLASFLLGTDTAGSGRVPAMLNNLVGIKPTVGLVPSTGVVPACRSVDCITVFAATVCGGAAGRRGAVSWKASMRPILSRAGRSRDPFRARASGSAFWPGRNANSTATAT